MSVRPAVAHQGLQIEPELFAAERLLETADDLLLEKALAQHGLVKISDGLLHVVPNRVQRRIRAPAHDRHGDRGVVDFVNAEMDVEGEYPAVERQLKHLRDVFQRFLAVRRLRDEQPELIRAQPSALAAGSLRDLPQHRARLDQRLVALSNAEYGVDQPKALDVRGHHDP